MAQTGAAGKERLGGYGTGQMGAASSALTGLCRGMRLLLRRTHSPDGRGRQEAGRDRGFSTEGWR